MKETTKEILNKLVHEFTDEDGSEYYEYVHYYETWIYHPEEPTWTCPIQLDGEFNARQLRMIADVLDRANAEESK